MDISNRIGFGCVGLTSQSSLKKAIALLDCAFDKGIRRFDTAPIYGQGYSEVIVGRFMAHKRDQIILTTKFGLGYVNKPSLPPAIALPLNYYRKKATRISETPDTVAYQKVQTRIITKQQVERDFLLSLKRLRTDYIDNYLLHEGIPSFLNEDAVEFLYKLKADGLVKRLGLGICYKNLEDIKSSEIVHWDILQYENNSSIRTGILYDRFPQKQHIYHSILKNINGEQKAGELMANILVEYPEAYILFSTSNRQHLINNVQETIDLYHNLK
jgi:aryl-alcohol dehydrogenase-like predicted oxidoreductase